MGVRFQRAVVARTFNQTGLPPFYGACLVSWNLLPGYARRMRMPRGGGVRFQRAGLTLGLDEHIGSNLERRTQDAHATGWWEPAHVWNPVCSSVRRGALT